MEGRHGKEDKDDEVYAAGSIIHLNAVVAWENELYVNVWTGPRMFLNL